MNIYMYELKKLAHYGVLDEMVDSEVEITHDYPLTIGNATVESAKKFGCVIEEEQYDNNSDEDFSDDFEYTDYDDYYERGRDIGYIPEGTVCNITATDNGSLVLENNGAKIYASLALRYDYNTKKYTVNVTPTKYGTIYFNYIKDNPNRPFDEAIEEIRNSAKIFGIDFNINYETHAEHIARKKRERFGG